LRPKIEVVLRDDSSSRMLRLESPYRPRPCENRFVVHIGARLIQEILFTRIKDSLRLQSRFFCCVLTLTRSSGVFTQPRPKAVARAAQRLRAACPREVILLPGRGCPFRVDVISHGVMGKCPASPHWWPETANQRCLTHPNWRSRRRIPPTLAPAPITLLVNCVWRSGLAAWRARCG
jgi:hypothetical protein